MTIYHKHHIIPRHMGGTDDPSNLIELTVEEHAEAHRKLFEEHGRWQDELAWKGLSEMIGKEEIIREIQVKKQLGKNLSEETRNKIRKKCEDRKKSGWWNSEMGLKVRRNLDRTGKEVSEQTREKIARIAKENDFGSNLPKLFGEKNHMKLPEYKKRASERMIGNKCGSKPKSEEHKRKIGLANKKRWQERKNNVGSASC